MLQLHLVHFRRRFRLGIAQIHVQQLVIAVVVQHAVITVHIVGLSVRLQIPTPQMMMHMMMVRMMATANIVQLPHVLLQIKVAAEALGADFARERLFVVVRVHVER